MATTATSSTARQLLTFIFNLLSLGGGACAGRGETTNERTNARHLGRFVPRECFLSCVIVDDYSRDPTDNLEYTLSHLSMWLHNVLFLIRSAMGTLRQVAGRMGRVGTLQMSPTYDLAMVATYCAVVAFSIASTQDASCTTSTVLTRLALLRLCNCSNFLLVSMKPPCLKSSLLVSGDASADFLGCQLLQIFPNGQEQPRNTPSLHSWCQPRPYERYTRLVASPCMYT